MRKTVPALAVLTLLCATRPADAVPLDESLLYRAAAFLADLTAPALDRLRHVWAQEGPAWDPNGRPIPPPTGATPPDSPPPI
jgi:hypothetical protein